VVQACGLHLSAERKPCHCGAGNDDTLGVLFTFLEALLWYFGDVVEVLCVKTQIRFWMGGGGPYTSCSHWRCRLGALKHVWVVAGWLAGWGSRLSDGAVSRSTPLSSVLLRFWPMKLERLVVAQSVR
jgi:hypothetical protein